MLIHVLCISLYCCVILLLYGVVTSRYLYHISLLSHHDVSFWVPVRALCFTYGYNIHAARFRGNRIELKCLGYCGCLNCWFLLNLNSANFYGQNLEKVIPRSLIQP